MSTAPEIVFYDGGCGVCHAFVRFVAKRDARGAFHFAPLGGEAFARVIPEGRRGSLPDSVVLQTADGRTLLRSAAVLHVLERVGGGYRIVAALARLVPRFLRDWAYDLVASLRRRLAAPPPDVCPVVAPELRERFLR